MKWVFPVEVVAPHDSRVRADLKQFVDYYSTKYMTCSRLHPKTILEIGVRAGYSAFAFLSSNPAIKYIGIDLDRGTDGNAGGPWLPWARQILSRFDNVALIQADSRLWPLRVPGRCYDLIHIDGCHTTEACYSDLSISWQLLRKGGMILIDDFDYISEVRGAAIHFLRAVSARSSSYVNSLRGELIIRRTMDEERAPSKKWLKWNHEAMR